MINILCVANESDRDYEYHGEDNYFIVQGRTLESCKKNFLKYIRGYWYHYEYEFNECKTDKCDGDINAFLRREFSDKHETDDNWCDLFDFCLPKPNHAGVVEITQEMHNMILENLDLVENMAS